MEREWGAVMEKTENTLKPRGNIQTADLDALTGLLNREATMRCMEEFLQGACPMGSHALIVLDIDDLGAINETLGHRSGDQAIRSTAQVIASHFRKNDIVGRTGGDAFSILVKDVYPDDIVRKARKLLNSLQFVLSHHERQFITSASAGIVMCRGGIPREEGLADLYAQAEAALHKAKDDGKNTCVLAGEHAPRAVSDAAVTESGLLSLALPSLLNHLRIGIVIFHGESPDELVPIFCNEGYLQMSSLSYEQFKHTLVKSGQYGIHPADMEGVRKAFVQAYYGDRIFQHTMRVQQPGQGEKWVTMFGSIQPLAGGDFDVYTVFVDAERDVHERELDMLRYERYIEAIQRKSAKALSTLHMNLTTNRCRPLHRTIQVRNDVVLEGSVDAFINTAAENVAYAEERAEFLQTFSREALCRSFDAGIFSIEMKLPIRLQDQSVLWCLQIADCSKNPLTGELEGIMRLVDADVLLRVSNHYERILQADYEYVADINAETGLLTVVSEMNDRGAPRTGSGFSYMSNMPERMQVLVEDEFVEEAIRAMSLDTVRSVLETEDLYSCAFPAKKSLLGRDGAFQWRFGYADSKKRDILFTRREMMGFLDRRQKAQTEELVLPSIEPWQLKRRRILIADDAEMNRELLSMIFEEEFEIIEAADGEEAIRLIDENYRSLALILLDLQMPKKTGLDVLIHLKMRDLTDMIPVIMVTGSISTDANLRSLEYGIADIVSKPFDSKVVKRRALNLIEQYAHKEDVEWQLEQWKQEAMQLHIRTEKNNELLINALSSVVEFRNLESGLHINRVRKLTEIMLKTWTAIHPEDRFDRDTISQISRASTLHDIGKVAIPDSILLKPGKLTAEEFDEMKNHTLYGCRMLESFKDEDSEFYRYCYEIRRYHHERSDGRGYPDGLTGEQIPIWAQIVSVADVFDALISPRVYKAPYPPDVAVEMIRSGECGCFSEKLLACFEAAKEQIIAESSAMTKEE